MTSLKQEMRQMFEKHSSMAFYENNSGFEDGLLEKIINLAYASLSPYTSKQWNIIAVRTPVLLQKLYKTAMDKKILESAIALIVCGSADLTHVNSSKLEIVPESDLRNMELLALSIGYAAKYYCIDYFMTKTFDSALVTREFALDRQQPAAAIICLGCFRNSISPYIPSNRNLYADTVRIL